MESKQKKIKGETYNGFTMEIIMAVVVVMALAASSQASPFSSVAFVCRGREPREQRELECFLHVVVPPLAGEGESRVR